MRRLTVAFKPNLHQNFIKTSNLVIFPHKPPPPSTPPPPNSLKHEFYGLTSGFTRLIIKTKYVYHGLISVHVNFHENRTK